MLTTVLVISKQPSSSISKLLVSLKKLGTNFQKEMHTVRLVMITTLKRTMRKLPSVFSELLMSPKKLGTRPQREVSI